MSRISIKNQPGLKLIDLLRRRKMTLNQFLIDLGITTREALSVRCDRMGVLAPSADEFEAARPNVTVNSPTEGIVVVDALPVIKESSGRGIDVESGKEITPGPLVKLFVTTEHGEAEELLGDPTGEHIVTPEKPKRKPRKKDDGQPGDASE